MPTSNDSLINLLKEASTLTQADLERLKIYQENHKLIGDIRTANRSVLLNPNTWISVAVAGVAIGGFILQSLVFDIDLKAGELALAEAKSESAKAEEATKKSQLLSDEKLAENEKLTKRLEEQRKELTETEVNLDRLQSAVGRMVNVAVVTKGGGGASLAEIPIGGTITDLFEVPIVGAKIVVGRSGETVAEGNSDQEGQFLLSIRNGPPVDIKYMTGGQQVGVVNAVPTGTGVDLTLRVVESFGPTLGTPIEQIGRLLTIFGEELHFVPMHNLTNTQETAVRQTFKLERDTRILGVIRDGSGFRTGIAFTTQGVICSYRGVVTFNLPYRDFAVAEFEFGFIGLSLDGKTVLTSGRIENFRILLLAVQRAVRGMLSEVHAGQ